MDLEKKGTEDWEMKRKRKKEKKRKTEETNRKSETELEFDIEETHEKKKRKKEENKGTTETCLVAEIEETELEKNRKEEKKKKKKKKIESDAFKYLDSIIQQLESDDFKISKDLLHEICLLAEPILQKESKLLELQAPIIICGDIRGQLGDLLFIMKKYGNPSTRSYLFLGNYVDRVSTSFATIGLLLLYKIRYPNKVFLLKGSHECDDIGVKNGFFNECREKYGEDLCTDFSVCFRQLPVAAIVCGSESAKRILCVHGGISDKLKSLVDIKNLHCETPSKNQVLVDLISSNPRYVQDPLKDEQQVFAFDPDEVIRDFDAAAVKDFIEKHNVDFVCRSHQLVNDGYVFFADESLVTLFSAHNYRGEFGNSSAVMRVTEDLMKQYDTRPGLLGRETDEIHSLIFRKKPYKSASMQSNEVLLKIRTILAASRSQLGKIIHVIPCQGKTSYKVNHEEECLELWGGRTFKRNSVYSDISIKLIANEQSMQEAEKHGSKKNPKVSNLRRNIQFDTVLLEIAQLLDSSKFLRINEFLYRHKNLFSPDEENDDLLGDMLSQIQMIIGCRRVDLHILTNCKGMVVGNITFMFKGVSVDCQTPTTIPDNIGEVTDIAWKSVDENRKTFILIVEKDSCLNRLFVDGFVKKRNCIIITGKGQPDNATRAFTYEVIKVLNCKNVYGLFDYNPSGIRIYIVYRYGSKKFAHENHLMVASGLTRIGITSTDIGDERERYIRTQLCTPGSIDFVEVATKMLNLEYKEIAADLEDMITRRLEAQIETINKRNYDCLQDVYLPEKLDL